MPGSQTPRPPTVLWRPCTPPIASPNAAQGPSSASPPPAPDGIRRQRGRESAAEEEQKRRCPHAAARAACGERRAARDGRPMRWERARREPPRRSPDAFWEPWTSKRSNLSAIRQAALTSKTTFCSAGRPSRNTLDLVLFGSLVTKIMPKQCAI